MRNIILYIVIGIPILSFAQDEAAEIAVSIFTSTLPEAQSLNHIRKDQDTILMYHKNITQKMSAILVLKEAELLSLEKTPAKIETTTPYLDTFNYLDQIIAINTNTINLIDEFPEFNSIPITAILDITEQSYDFVSDFRIILSDGKDNQMLPTARYELISKINIQLAKIYSFSVAFNELLRLNTLTAGVDLKPINISGPINETLNEISSMINEL